MFDLDGIKKLNVRAAEKERRDLQECELAFLHAVNNGVALKWNVEILDAIQDALSALKKAGGN